jgi:hypothetical protein
VNTLNGIAEAIDRLRLYFAPAETRQGILARRALGEPGPDDAALSSRLVTKMQAEIRPDGSISGGVVATIWRAHELLDLESGPGHPPGWMQIMNWVLALQGRPGAFSQGCTPARHSYRSCEHFVSAFFSPGPPEQRISPIMLPNGKVYRGEPAARFAISCMALRAALRGNLQRKPIEQHLKSLLLLEEQWHDWSGYFAPDVIVAGIHALALAPAPYRDVLPKLGSMLAAYQADDGTWPKADLYYTLETLVALGTPETHESVRRAVPALLARQRIDGGFGPTAPQERSLIALRALIWADTKG